MPAPSSPAPAVCSQSLRKCPKLPPALVVRPPQCRAEGTVPFLIHQAMLCLMHPGQGWPTPEAVWRKSEALISAYTLCQRVLVVPSACWGCKMRVMKHKPRRIL